MWEESPELQAKNRDKLKRYRVTGSIFMGNALCTLPNTHILAGNDIFLRWPETRKATEENIANNSIITFGLVNNMFICGDFNA